MREGENECDKEEFGHGKEVPLTLGCDLDIELVAAACIIFTDEEDNEDDPYNPGEEGDGNHEDDSDANYFQIVEEVLEKNYLHLDKIASSNKSRKTAKKVELS